MKHLLLFAITIIALGTMTQAVQAERPYNVRDLRGTYVFNLMEIRQEPGSPIDYCDHHGTATFDGAGNGTSAETRKCSATGNVTERGRFTYTVSASGEVLITEVPDPPTSTRPLPTRAQIVEKGRMLLIDGTTREPNIYVQHGVAVRTGR